MTGWWSPTYASIEPCTAVEVHLPAGARAYAWFGPDDATHMPQSDLDRLVDQLVPTIGMAGRSW